MFLCCAIVVAAIAGYQQNAGAVSQPRALITETISETELVTLAGNTRPEATAANDRGPLADSFPLEHLWLQLRRSPEREQALERYIDQLSDRNSPNFHHWLTAKQFGERYGLAQEDLAAITGWLGSHGFTVNLVYPSRVLIDFSGTAGQVREAFHTEIHNLEAKGEQHIANMSDPRIPAALAPAVVGVVSLNNFMPHPMHQPRSNYTAGDRNYLVVPADLATIYNLNPLFAAGYSGQGQTIMVVEDSDVYSASDWTSFRTTFGLASAYPDGSFTQVHPRPGGS
ncbi:MAG: protease pro-enzyme activation domain-containing protein, partial [Candidatus Sulfotelmatobacter sp.]